MSTKLILTVVVAGLVVLFIVQNVGAVEIRFLFWSFFGLRVSTFLNHLFHRSCTWLVVA